MGSTFVYIEKGFISSDKKNVTYFYTSFVRDFDFEYLNVSIWRYSSWRHDDLNTYILLTYSTFLNVSITNLNTGILRRNWYCWYFDIVVCVLSDWSVVACEIVFNDAWFWFFQYRRWLWAGQGENFPFFHFSFSFFTVCSAVGCGMLLGMVWYFYWHKPDNWCIQNKI